MVNEAFKSDLNKFVADTTVSTELTPGTPRRYEPEVGVAKHNARIHKETSFVDKHKKLEFSFTKPTFSGIKKTVVKLCSNCNAEVFVHTNAVGVICRACGKYASLKEVTIDGE